MQGKHAHAVWRTRNAHRVHRFAWRALIAFAVALIHGGDARAACNLIPVARSGYGSALGSVASPIAVPGDQVTLRISPCETSAGFEPTAAQNNIEIRFEPPAGLPPPAQFTTGTGTDVCTLPLGRCRELTFDVPLAVATDPPPHGRAGPARIIVRDSAAVRVAEIGELELPTLGCDSFPETVFEQFTVLPLPNNFADLVDGTTSEIHATVDGSGSLLVPFDYWGSGLRSVLAETPGAPIATFVEGAASIPADGAGDSHTILQVVSQQRQPSSFVRSFTLDGRPLPPLLRVTDAGSLFGTVDAASSVLRFARNDGRGGRDLFDLSDRVASAGGGPIVITTFSADTREPLPLVSLRSSADTVAYARSETRENLDLNLDGDTSDLVGQIVDAQTADAFPTNVAVDGGFGPLLYGIRDNIPPISVGSNVAAFVEREESNGTDRDGDGTLTSGFLRVFSETEELTAGQTIEVALGRSVDGQRAVVSDSTVLFRSGGMLSPVLLGHPLISKILVSPDGKHLYASGNARPGADGAGYRSHFHHRLAYR